MFTSYILDKDALAFLWELCGGSTDTIPYKFRTDNFDLNIAVQKLKRNGLIFVSEKRVDVERTLGFLITSMINSAGTEEKNESVIFDCGKLYIAARNDRLSSAKCLIVPLRDKEMLKEYLENDIISYEEE